jgi:hypothetical protein
MHTCLKKRSIRWVWVIDTEFLVLLIKGLAPIPSELATRCLNGEPIINCWVDWGCADATSMANAIIAAMPTAAISRPDLLRRLMRYFSRKSEFPQAMTPAQIRMTLMDKGFDIERTALLTSFGYTDTRILERLLSGAEMCVDAGMEMQTRFNVLELGQLVESLTPDLACHALGFVHWIVSKQRYQNRQPLTFHEADDDAIATAIVASDMVRHCLETGGL